MAKPIKQSKLTLKQKRFIKYYLEDGNATRAVLKAGYDCDENTARSIGSQNLTKLNITLKDIMEKKGLDLGSLVDSLSEGLQSWKVHTSHTEPDKKVPDFATRHRYLETASRWLNIDQPTNTQPVQTNVQINISRGDE